MNLRKKFWISALKKRLMECTERKELRIDENSLFKDQTYKEETYNY